MLYFRALLQGIAEMPEASAEFRNALDQRAAAMGWPALHAELADVDPVAAGRIGTNDVQRIQRALEVIALTGRSMSEVQQQARPPLPSVRFIRLGISPTDRETLYARIAARFHQMMTRGFLEEVRSLHQRGDLHSELPSMRAVGYRQLWKYLENEWSLEWAIEQGILATRHLARRQLIWMRALPELEWIDSVAADVLSQLQQRVGQLFG